MKLAYYCYIFLFSFSSLSQSNMNNWLFGQNVWLDFNTTPPTNRTGSLMDAQFEGVASFSDGNGNLRYYTEGRNIWGVRNSVHQIIPNGVGLLGSQSAYQAAVFIPNPIISNYIYVFTLDLYTGNNNLRVSTINTDLGLAGEVVVQSSSNIEKSINTLLLRTNSEKMAAYSNTCKDTSWLVTIETDSNRYFIYLIDSAGVSLHNSVPSTNNIRSIGHQKGMMKFSKNGTTIATAFYSEIGTGQIEICNFNPDNGSLTFNRIINTPMRTGPLEFSSNGRMLYYNSITGSNNAGIYQYDLLTNISRRIQQSSANPNNIYRGFMQIGNDNKIYLTSMSTQGGIPIGNSLDIINSPNNIGQACNYSSNSFQLANNTYMGLPTFLLSPNILKVNLDSNLIICHSNSTQIQARFDPTFKYTWSTGDTSFNTMVDSTGWYSLTIDSAGCTDTDSILVKFANHNSVNINNDTVLCNSDSILLFPDHNYESYLWNTNDTLPSIHTNKSGKYTLTVTDSFACSSTDSTTIIKDTVKLNILHPNISCPNDTIILKCDSSYQKYNWSNGDTTFSIKGLPGKYYLETVDRAGCLRKDSITSVTHTPKQVKISGDSLYCPDSNTLLDAGSNFVSYQWNNGIINQFNRVQKGIVSVIAKDLNNCASYDTINVYEKPNNKPTIFGNNLICLGDSSYVRLSSNYPFIKWSNGNNNFNNVISEGVHWVDVIDTNGCNFSDSIEIKYSRLNAPKIIGSTKQCYNEKQKLKVNDYFSSYIWNDNLFTSTVEVYPGKHYVEVIDKYNCVYFDTINISPELCNDSCNLFVPNSFTPNNDGINDEFAPVFNANCDLEDYKLEIFNRWGELIFQTNNIDQGWTGLEKSSTLITNIYVYRISFTKKDKFTSYRKGHITVLP